MSHPSQPGQPRGTLPRWLKHANRVLVALHRIGLTPGRTIWVLSVPGRKSGQLRTTPVSVLSLDGRRYLVGGMATADWVRNARAAGWGFLAHGRHRDRVSLVELPLEDRAPILRAFPHAVPGGVAFFQRLYGLSDDQAAQPEAFAALAPQVAVFRIDPFKT